MKIIIVTSGSIGDINPFIWMGRVLAKAGHQIVFLTNPYHEKMITAEGFEYYPVGTVDDYNIATAMPVKTGNKFKDNVELINVAKRLFDYLYLKPSKDIDDIILRQKTPDTIILNHFCMYGAKIAADKHKIQNISINLSPYCLMPFKATDSIPAFFENMMIKLISNFADNLLSRKKINSIRRENGLQVLKKSSSEWMYDGINWNLFPEWLVKFKISKNVNFEFIGFPGSLNEGKDLPQNIKNFLNTFEKPILFTPGTAFQNNKDFFNEAVLTLKKMSKPGIFLTKFKDELPDKLPNNIFYAEYLPLELLLDKCSAIAHHGGIGTCYEGLKAGIPQLICYRIDEQKDNSRTLKSLGVSNQLSFKCVDSKSLLENLQIIYNKDVLAKCNEIKNKLRAESSERNLLKCFERLEQYSKSV